MQHVADADPVPASELARFRADGACVVRGVFGPEEIAAMRVFDVPRLLAMAAADERLRGTRIDIQKRRDDGRETVMKIEGLREVVPEMERFCMHPRLLAIAQRLMAERPLLFKDKYILKDTGSGGFPAHQDMPYGFHRFITRALSCMIALDPADQGNGCLEVASVQRTPSMVAPAERGLDPRLIPEDAWRPVPLQPGDVCCFDGLTPHRSAPNASPRPRRVYIVTYNGERDGDQYRAYYDWYYAWRRHEAGGGQRNDYCGDPPRRSRPGLGSYAQIAPPPAGAY